MPNAIATLALAAWPLVTLALFMRLRIDLAIIWSLMLGYLFLPETPAMLIDPPLMPELNKQTIPALAVFLCVLMRHGLSAPILPQTALPRAFILVFLFSPLLTALTNDETISYGVVELPGHDLKSSVGMIVTQFLMVLPFLLARQFMASAESLRSLVKAIVAGALVYSVLMLIEVRFSPQLNVWIYGYFQHDFSQTIRFGGWRPTVFLIHGLWVAFFVMSATLCAWALWKTDPAPGNRPWLLVAVYLTAILILAKSLGAILYALAGLPILLLLRRETVLRLSLAVALLASAYPLIKAADTGVEDRLVGAFAAYVPERAESLAFRFSNETELMVRANEKPLFGWGGYARNHFHDPFTGRLLTVTDGRWIILIGTYGWVGYIAEFGLLLSPLLLIWRAHRTAGADDQAPLSPLVPVLCLLLAINLVDLLPNATLTPLTWLIAGALLGHAEARERGAAPAHRRPRNHLVWRPAM